MLPRLLQLHPKTYQRLARLRREAERDGAYRVAKRLHAVLLNADGHSSGRIAEILKAPRSKASEWLTNYDTHGEEGLLEGSVRDDRHVCRKLSAPHSAISLKAAPWPMDSTRESGPHL